MRLIISSPDGLILSRKQVEWVNLVLSHGERISIYPKHATLAALTSSGCLKYQAEGQLYEQEVASGILYISEDTIKYLVTGEFSVASAEAVTSQKGAA